MFFHLLQMRLRAFDHHFLGRFQALISFQVRIRAFDHHFLGRFQALISFQVRLRALSPSNAPSSL
jgi:hypothetical protein